MNPALFSSATDEWATPGDLIAALRSKFPFELDVCATAENAKAPRFFTKADDGLKQEWRGVCWMNPPYRNPEAACGANCKRKRCAKRGYHNAAYVPGTRDWIAKAVESSKQGATVVCLLPARTDTKWFQTHCYPVLRSRPEDVEFLAGRLKFGGAKAGAPFPSVLVVFRPPAA
jgi:phage N-6-adenine-methyltransferase